MPRQMNRAERETAFMNQAKKMFGQLEDWYDAHPDATFGELEQVARQQRREMMGAGLAIVVNGRDTGKQPVAPSCNQCEQRMRFKGYRPKWVQGLEGDSQLERAYYVCPDCQGATIFPPR